jgi:hypothetical protein
MARLELVDGLAGIAAAYRDLLGTGLSITLTLEYQL